MMMTGMIRQNEDEVGFRRQLSQVCQQTTGYLRVSGHLGVYGSIQI